MNAAILQRGTEINCRPLSVLVVEPGCKVKAFQKEDGSSMITGRGAQIRPLVRREVARSEWSRRLEVG